MFILVSLLRSALTRINHGRRVSRERSARTLRFIIFKQIINTGRRVLLIVIIFFVYFLFLYGPAFSELRLNYISFWIKARAISVEVFIILVISGLHHAFSDQFEVQVLQKIIERLIFSFQFNKEFLRMTTCLGA